MPVTCKLKGQTFEHNGLEWTGGDDPDLLWALNYITERGGLSGHTAGWRDELAAIRVKEHWPEAIIEGAEGMPIDEGAEEGPDQGRIVY